MDARLDMAGGKPVLRLEARGRDYSGVKRAVFDLPISPEQAKLIDLHTNVFTR